MTTAFPFRVGQGHDLHVLAEGRPLIIGGVRIPHDRGLVGHSDADALLTDGLCACNRPIGGGTL